MSPLGSLVLWASLAAGAAALGALPAAFGRELGPGPLAWGRALAAGLMLGAAYLLTQEGVALTAVGGATGSALGILAVAAWQRWTAIDDLDGDPAGGPEAEDVSATLRRGALHSGAEGVAMGASFVVHPTLGLFMAATFALHNVPEGAALVAGLTRQGRSVAGATGLTLLVKASQPILAGLAGLVSFRFPPLLPWTLGFAAGAMFYLLLVDLLPQAYRHRGHVGIAVVTSVALSAIVLLHPLVVGR